MSNYIDQFKIKIDKINSSGDGLGFYNGKKVFVYGALMGETVMVRSLKKKRGFIQGKVLEVLEKTTLRREPKERHYLSCSPWQIMNDSDQVRLKKELAIKSFEENNIDEYPEPEIIASQNLWHYRNKMEFSFTYNEDNNLSLALHLRGSHRLMAPLNECLIAHQRINEVAQSIVKVLQKEQIELNDLKTLIIRYSYLEDKCLAVLYVTNQEFIKINVDLKELAGFLIIYSNPESPASVTDKLLYKTGCDYLIEELAGFKFKYYYDSFFQGNPKGFTTLISYVRENISAGNKILDLYAGVGTLGFCLADKFKEVFSFENDIKASQAAMENTELNKLTNIKVINGLAEKSELVDLFGQANTLLVDPPRSGLHPKVVSVIVDSGPENFIYVSCNPQTQASDLKFLQKKYRLISWRLFDLYPQTPHCESAVILQRMSR